jgi:hypothetical protein
LGTEHANSRDVATGVIVQRDPVRDRSPSPRHAPVPNALFTSEIYSAHRRYGFTCQESVRLKKTLEELRADELMAANTATLPPLGLRQSFDLLEVVVPVPRVLIEELVERQPSVIRVPGSSRPRLQWRVAKRRREPYVQRTQERE